MDQKKLKEFMLSKYEIQQDNSYKRPFTKPFVQSLGLTLLVFIIFNYNLFMKKSNKGSYFSSGQSVTKTTFTAYVVFFVLCLVILYFSNNPTKSVLMNEQPQE